MTGKKRLLLALLLSVPGIAQAQAGASPPPSAPAPAFVSVSGDRPPFRDFSSRRMCRDGVGDRARQPPDPCRNLGRAGRRRAATGRRRRPVSHRLDEQGLHRSRHPQAATGAPVAGRWRNLRPRAAVMAHPTADSRIGSASAQPRRRLVTDNPWGDRQQPLPTRFHPHAGRRRALEPRHDPKYSIRLRAARPDHHQRVRPTLQGLYRAGDHAAARHIATGYEVGIALERRASAIAGRTSAGSQVDMAHGARSARWAASDQHQRLCAVDRLSALGLAAAGRPNRAGAAPSVRELAEVSISPAGAAPRQRRRSYPAVTRDGPARRRHCDLGFTLARWRRLSRHGSYMLLLPDRDVVSSHSPTAPMPPVAAVFDAAMELHGAGLLRPRPLPVARHAAGYRAAGAMYQAGMSRAAACSP